MNGTMAQLVALALHGNGVLAGTPSPDFLLQNSTAQFCETVQFVAPQTTFFGFGKQTEVQVADSPNAWFAYLKGKKAKQLSVRWQAGGDPEVPDRKLAGFVGGGGTWLLVIRFKDGHLERWLARWEVGDKQRKDRKIWRVTYGCVTSDSRPPTPVLPVQEAIDRMKKALLDIRAFSAAHKCDGFTQHFDRGLKSLAHEREPEPYHRDLFPQGITPADPTDLLYACQHAWVFGGMGSWNDMTFSGVDDKEYDRVSEQLFQAIALAIPSAVEAYANRAKSP
jgi:hypothetical protein